ncbi:MAG: hypothetical protein O8C64_09135 [Candidatus Methanoperedens sp.]|nr:hypothetical protein [Candidatus Methanoperedens sp.]
MEITKMIKIYTIFVLMFILAMPATAANVTKVEIHGVVFDQSSKTYNTTLVWDAQNFTGFWYASGGAADKSSKKIFCTIPRAQTKTIPCSQKKAGK